MRLSSKVLITSVLSCLLHMQGVLFWLEQASVYLAVKAGRGVGGCAACGSPCSVQQHPDGEPFHPHYFQLNQHSPLFPPPRALPLQPCRAKAEQSGSDVSAVLTSPHRRTDRERVIRGKTHMRGERPVFSGKAVRIHLNDSVSYASQAGKFHHRCMMGAQNHRPICWQECWCFCQATKRMNSSEFQLFPYCGNCFIMLSSF